MGGKVIHREVNGTPNKLESLGIPLGQKFGLPETSFMG